MTEDVRAAIIKSLDGEEPDNLIPSSFGVVVDGPPPPGLEAEEEAFSEKLRQHLVEVVEATAPDESNGQASESA
jgi:hypothetical protein